MCPPPTTTTREIILFIRIQVCNDNLYLQGRNVTLVSPHVGTHRVFAPGQRNFSAISLPCHFLPAVLLWEFLKITFITMDFLNSVAKSTFTSFSACTLILSNVLDQHSCALLFLLSLCVYYKYCPQYIALCVSSLRLVSTGRVLFSSPALVSEAGTSLGEKEVTLLPLPPPARDETRNVINCGSTD